MKKYLIAVSTLLSLYAAGYAQQTMPNVVVILADDLGFGDVSAYGSTTIHTPAIDRLAREGVCFNNGYATSATSTPSRYGLLTGMYPWKDDAKILNGDAPLIINPDGFTLPKMMQEHGYVTGAIGKWHLGMGNGNVDWNTLITPGAREVGFDFSCIAAATNDRVPTVFVENGYVLNLDRNDPIYVDYEKGFEGVPTALGNPELVTMPWSHGHHDAVINGIPRIGFMKGGESAIWRDEDLADFYVNKVKDFITANADTPFFLYYGLHQPHVPRTPHSRFVGATTMGPRGDTIVEADWCVGEVMALLDSLNLLDNTLIVFSSDNGPVLDDGYHDDSVEKVGDHHPTGGLRGGKYSLFDGGTHVPLFVYWKGHSEPVVSDALFCQMDIIASVAALIGAEVPKGLDTQCHLDAMLGKSPRGRDELVFEAGGRLGLRSGKWIMIPPYKGPKQNKTGNELGNLADFALFDVEADPFQTTNIAEQRPEMLEQLKARFFTLTEGYYPPAKK